jgi:very-short-patch-repair endonuclease
MREGLGVGKPTFKSRNTQTAKALRHAATPAERRLWHYLARRQLGGHKFSRQMPIGSYVVDFLCREQKLIIEVDGYSHDLRSEADQQRTAWLEGEGFLVLRFGNADVMEAVEGVLHSIARTLADRVAAHPQPLPQAGGEIAII